MLTHSRLGSFILSCTLNMRAFGETQVHAFLALSLLRLNRWSGHTILLGLLGGSGGGGGGGGGGSEDDGVGGDGGGGDGGGGVLSYGRSLLLQF